MYQMKLFFNFLFDHKKKNRNIIQNFLFSDIKSTNLRPVWGCADGNTLSQNEKTDEKMKTI